MNTNKQDKLKIFYTVLHDKSTSDEELALSKSSSKRWSSLTSKVFCNKYLDIVNMVSKLRFVLRNHPHDRLKLEELLPVLSENNIIGIVDLISCSFLFNRSPLDLQLFILSGLGVTPSMLEKSFNK